METAAANQTLEERYLFPGSPDGTFYCVPQWMAAFRFYVDAEAGFIAQHVSRFELQRLFVGHLREPLEQ